MFTQICTLTFPDRQTVTGKVSVEGPYDSAPVEYSGSVSLLPRRFEITDPRCLVALFKNAARETGAKFSESSSGEYDYAE